MKLKIYIVLFICTLYSLNAQRFKTEAYRSYIDKHGFEAIKQMEDHGVPASITMAQALIESGAGQSMLSTEFNNHFGIKCHASWTGGRTYKKDDSPNDCFRTYNKWEDSYNDHSLFLKQNRYKELFNYDQGDYKSWAKGLQKCGYATNRGYANMLITVIEDCQLYLLDEGKMPSWVSNKEYYNSNKKAQNSLKKQKNNYTRKNTHEAFLSYKLLYVVAKSGDTFEAIAKEFDLKGKDVAAYNDAPIDFALKAGDIVYLQEKNERATDNYHIYQVVVGDSMHSISQKFGIKLDNLYKLNQKDPDYIPYEGDIIRLR